MIQWKSLLIDLNNISLFHISFSEIRKKSKKKERKLFKEAVTRQYQVPSVNCFVIELATVVSVWGFESYPETKKKEVRNRKRINRKKKKRKINK